MAKVVKKICPVCRKQYNADPQRLKHGRQTTCSRACSYKLRFLHNRKERVQYTCKCGKKFERRLSESEKSIKKYCSQHCSWKYHEIYKTRWDKGIKRVPQKEYKCFFCGRVFYKYKVQRSSKRVFCDRKCYEKQKSIDMSGRKNHMYGKTPDHWGFRTCVIDGKKHKFRSSWEFSVAKYLTREKICWKYEYKRFELNEDLTYLPDFFIFNNDNLIKIIEVKGWIKKKDTIKIKLFRENYDIPLEVWDRKKMKKMGLLNSNGYGI